MEDLVVDGNEVNLADGIGVELEIVVVDDKDGIEEVAEKVEGVSEGTFDGIELEMVDDESLGLIEGVDDGIKLEFKEIKLGYVDGIVDGGV